MEGIGLSRSLITMRRFLSYSCWRACFLRKAIDLPLGEKTGCELDPSKPGMGRIWGWGGEGCEKEFRGTKYRSVRNGSGAPIEGSRATNASPVEVTSKSLQASGPGERGE